MPGFELLRLDRCLETPTRYLLLVEWSQLEDHTIGFRESPEYSTLASAPSSLLRAIPERGALRDSSSHRRCRLAPPEVSSRTLRGQQISSGSPCRLGERSYAEPV